MSTTPRTPEHFPKMKHRAAGRAIRRQDRQIREAVRAWSAFAAEVEKANGRISEALAIAMSAIASHVDATDVVLPTVEGRPG